MGTVKSTYAEQLRHPMWQKRRLEIMERDGWMCKSCGSKDDTLTVHHKSYRYQDGEFADLWDYGDGCLTTLCESCHNEEEQQLAELKKEVYFSLREICEDSSAINEVVSCLHVLMCKKQSRVKSQDITKIFKNGGVL